jgi:polyisoprenoid-binding protein YceI
VPKFPQASFQSSAVKAAGPGKFEVAGKLTIKGVVRDVSVPVQVTQAGATSTATGTFAIKRLAFKVGEGEWTDTSMLADDVQIRFKLVLSGLAPL